MTTKCEISENYQVLLRGIIISRPKEPEKLVLEDLESSDPDENRDTQSAPEAPAADV